jgi:hypothetical protein
MQTPRDAAVGKSVDQPLRSLLQPQQLLASLLVVKAIIQTDGIVTPDREIKLSGDIDNEAVLYWEIERCRLMPA